MTKLYRYRPLSDLLFKELYYQELYFASYDELNDPLDLSVRIDFSPEKESDIGYLLWFLFKTSLKLLISETPSRKDKEVFKKLTSFNDSKELRTKLKVEIFKKVSDLKVNSKCVHFQSLERIITKTAKELDIDFPIDFTFFKEELKRLTKVFIENSNTVCFSESNDNFLMWSHYSSKHSGICLEFSLQKEGLFPYEMQISRKPNKEEYEKGFSKLNIETHLFYNRIHKVVYQQEQPYINFFEFAAVFENEGDCDLMELSKSRWHGYALELEMIFGIKTLPWAYEKEWRAIEIHFGNPELPENKIRHYPIEALSAIYFGIKTPLTVKKRIAAIYRHKHTEIQFFNSILSNGELEFIEWEVDEN